MIRVCVVGCGAIGGLYAAHLAQLEDVEVWAYDVSEDHVAAINAAGLRVTGAASLLASVQATTDPAAIPACEFGIVATKGTVTEAAIAATAAALAGAVVCSLQNGIGNEEVIAEFVPRVVRGVALPAGGVAVPGVIHMDASGTTWIGPFEPRPPAAHTIDRLGALLERAGMPTVVCRDARGPQWTKLLFNASTNPLCALTGLTHGQLWDLPDTQQLIGELVREGKVVAAALGIVLDDDPLPLIEEAARTNHRHQPSMLQDVLARRPTEVETLNGGIVREGQAVGVATPQHQSVAALIHGLQTSWGS